MLFPAVPLMGERPETDLFYGATAFCWRLASGCCASGGTSHETSHETWQGIPIHDWLTAAAAARFCISSRETSSLCVAIVH